MVRDAVEAGLEFVRAAQSAEGYWSDWTLPPGESRMWTTAYVGYRLSSLGPRRDTAPAESLQRAEEWLRAAEFPSGGWGYSDQTGPDGDSTALAILFLRARGSPVLDRSVRCLYLHQRYDGGVATYTQDASYGSWVQSHPEITAVAAHAMMSIHDGEPRRVARALRHLRSLQRADGLWDSFWWTTSAYATEASLAALVRAGEPFDCETTRRSLLSSAISTSFDSALRLLALGHVGYSGAGHLASALCAAQLPDGSWPGDAEVRLTPRDCRDPWNELESVRRFVDHRRVFTTATVLAALGSLDLR